jgi:hypothetical protein
MATFEQEVTTRRLNAIMNAGFSCVVTASAEQMPNTCTVIGLSISSGLEISFLFFLENSGSLFFSTTTS